MTRGSRWHVFYPSGSQEAGWADQWDRLPVSRLLWLLWTVPQRRGLDFLGNFCFSYTVNILPPLPALSCCLQCFPRSVGAPPPPPPPTVLLPFCLIFDAGLTVLKQIKEARPTMAYPHQQEMSRPTLKSFSRVIFAQVSRRCDLRCIIYQTA